jgi:hypothetical protein
MFIAVHVDERLDLKLSGGERVVVTQHWFGPVCEKVRLSFDLEQGRVVDDRPKRRETLSLDAVQTSCFMQCQCRLVPVCYIAPPVIVSEDVVGSWRSDCGHLGLGNWLGQNVRNGLMSLLDSPRLEPVGSYAAQPDGLGDPAALKVASPAALASRTRARWRR